jgi:hypothetical protein
MIPFIFCREIYILATIYSIPLDQGQGVFKHASTESHLSFLSEVVFHLFFKVFFYKYIKIIYIYIYILKKLIFNINILK